VVVATPAQRARIRRSGTETVLLIEDDVAVRDRVRRLLEGSGYRVLEAPDGEHALDLVAREGEPIDLLVTDVGLPGMDGLSVAHRLKEMSPNVRALIISGYSKERILQRWILDGQADILSKPFTQEELLSLTRAMLDHA
jgi:two-component system cell cycle sensor histidine kinase/response regulator CckA